MKNKFSLALIALSLLVLVSGCNSDGAFSGTSIGGSEEDGVTKPELGGSVVEIAVTPSPISALWRIPKQMRAIAKYDDGSEVDITDTAEWAIVTDPVDFADLTSTGLLTPKVKTSDKVVASKDGLFSPETEVTVSDLSEAYIDIYDTGEGKLFTNSPSVNFIQDSGYESGQDQFEENEFSGPVGYFTTYRWDQANDLCESYNEDKLGGRTNWRLPEKEELKDELLGRSSNLFARRGWPVGLLYWSATPAADSKYYYVNLRYGTVDSNDFSSLVYVSCVSDFK